jgi:hypothetical protein
MCFKTRVTGCYWEADKGEWRVTLTQTNPDGFKKELEERCNVLLSATGVLNNYKWPDVEGIDKFKGRVGSQCIALWQSLLHELKMKSDDPHRELAGRLPGRAVEARHGCRDRQRSF